MTFNTEKLKSGLMKQNLSCKLNLKIAINQDEYNHGCQYILGAG